MMLFIREFCQVRSRVQKCLALIKDSQMSLGLRITKRLFPADRNALQLTYHSHVAELILVFQFADASFMKSAVAYTVYMCLPYEKHTQLSIRAAVCVV